MLKLDVRSSDNALIYNLNERTYTIQETLTVMLDYDKSVEDLQAYEAMVTDLMGVLLRHCPEAKLPLTKEQISAIQKGIITRE